MNTQKVEVQKIKEAKEPVPRRTAPIAKATNSNYRYKIIFPSGYICYTNYRNVALAGIHHRSHVGSVCIDTFKHRRIK